MSKVDTAVNMLPEKKLQSNGFKLTEYLGTHLGGKELSKFLEVNAAVGQFYVLGSVAEIARGLSDSATLDGLNIYWGGHRDDFPYRKSVANDLDLVVVASDEVKWKPVDGVDVQIKEMNDGQQMLLAGVDLPIIGGHTTRRDNFKNKNIWAEIVPKDLCKGTLVEQMAAQGYSQYTAVSKVDSGLVVSENPEDIKWVGREKLVRVKTVTGETLNEALGRDTKYLKLAVKSVVNVALAYGGELPFELRDDLVNLLSDRVALLKEDWNEYQLSRVMFGADTGLVTAEPLEIAANNTFLWNNVIERMADAWVVLGPEATKLFEETGLTQLVFGGEEQFNKDPRKTIVDGLEQAISLANWKSAFGQEKRLEAELVGFKKLFASSDLKI